MAKNPAQKMVSYLEANPKVVHDGEHDAHVQEKETQVLKLIKKLRSVADSPQGTAKEFREIYANIEALGCHRKYGDLKPALDFLKDREKGGQ